MDRDSIKMELITFLKEKKNVPNEAIKKDVILSIKGENGYSIYTPHLLVTNNQAENQTLCLFIIDDKKDRVLQSFIEIHLKHINRFLKEPTIVYLVTKENGRLSFSEILDDTSLIPIEPNDFPAYEMMKNNLLVLQGMELQNHEEKKRIFKVMKTATSWVLFTTLITIIVTFFSLFFINPPTKQDDTISIDADKTTVSLFMQEMQKIDSTYNVLKNSISEYEKKLEDTTFISTGTKDFLLYEELEKRIKSIEQGFNDNPEKILSIINLHNEINLLEEKFMRIEKIMQVKIDYIENRSTYLINLAISLFSGLFVFIFGALFGFIRKFSNIDK